MKPFAKKLSIVALAVLLPVLSWADSYCPKKGEEFVFYPVSKVYKQVIKGYDCFYVPELAYKNGQTYPEREYRFRVDANGVTPYSEIEGHTFVLENALKENSDKPVSQQNFLCFLVRDDGERLLLRIPFVRKSTDNTLTRGMTVILNEKNSFRTGPSLCLINIPACPVSQLEKLSGQMAGQTLSRQMGRDVDMTVSTLVKYLNKDLGDEIVRSTSVYCDSISFVDVKGYVFRQPLAFGNLKGKKIKLPVFDFRGNGESVYGSYFRINTVFRAPAENKPLLAENTTKSVLATEPEVEETPKPVAAEPKPATVEPKPVTVEAKPVAPESRIVAEEEKPVTVETPKLTKEKETTVVANADTKQTTEEVSYIIEEVPVETNLWVIDEKPKNVVAENKIETKAVEIPSQPVVVKKVAEPKKVAAATSTTPVAPVEIKTPEITVKSEGPDPEIQERLAKERLADLTKRFGAKNAKIIADGKVSIGFSQEMCKEALGEPDYINTTQNMFTTLEQWVYGHDLYLYFQKGKLQSIDEF